MAATLHQQLDRFTVGMGEWHTTRYHRQCKEKFLTRLVLLFADLAVLMILKFMLLCGYKNMAVNNIYAFQSKYVDFIIYTLS